MASEPEPPPRGPWSDLPPAPPAPRRPGVWGSGAPWRRVGPGPRKARREPIITNWKGLLIVLFLFLVAPVLANIVARVILGLFPHSGL